uniref:Uncharacterized protein AlNc14C294G10274 n=1 Tax=Albugo laibachii Nc14 TaxID=890382 RepID=F0WVD0_9STRA|nr:conserved hypothetical protein [Albugo laibachii Nc14]|eukprot:CCA25369.1 conserved hypothetical protein [Albugo laibachii Nc14]
MQSLAERLVQSLYACKRFKVVGSITGGGVSACGLLITTGSSSTILELGIPYSRASLTESLSAVRSAETSFCSVNVAEQMASICVSRADFLSQKERKCESLLMESLSQLIKRYEMLLGFGCTASLTTNRVKKSGTDQCFLSICRAMKRPGKHRVMISQYIHQTYRISFDTLQTRREQDELAAFWIVYALSQAEPFCENESNRRRIRELLMLQTKVAEREYMQLSGDTVCDMIREVASASSDRLLSILLLEDLSIGEVRDVIVNLPFRGLVFPGSFNPLHDGHLQLMKIAAKLVQEYLKQSAFPPIAFEIAAGNADKGKVDENEILKRVSQFQNRSESLPVFVTNATFFLEKAKLFRSSWFVIGADTAIRLVDSKYYGDECQMAITMNEIISTLECRFVVAGRWVETSGRYWSAMEIVENVIPKQFRHAFLPISDESFRMDISSTELRKRATGKAFK